MVQNATHVSENYKVIPWTASRAELAINNNQCFKKLYKNESLLSINPVFASLDPPLNPVSTKISTHRTVCQLMSLMKEKLR